MQCLPLNEVDAAEVVSDHLGNKPQRSRDKWQQVKHLHFSDVLIDVHIVIKVLEIELIQTLLLRQHDIGDIGEAYFGICNCTVLRSCYSSSYDESMHVHNAYGVHCLSA